MDLFSKEFLTKADHLLENLDIQAVTHTKAIWANSSHMAKVYGNKKTVHSKGSLKMVNSSMVLSHTLINLSTQDKWDTTKSAAKIVSSSMQMGRNLLENLDITNFSKVHFRKKMVLLIKELLKMERSMEEEFTFWKVFFNTKDSSSMISFMAKVSWGCWNKVMSILVISFAERNMVKVFLRKQ